MSFIAIVQDSFVFYIMLLRFVGAAVLRDGGVFWENFIHLFLILRVSQISHKIVCAIIFYMFWFFLFHQNSIIINSNCLSNGLVKRCA